jgi:hypothetical protein
MKEMIMDAIRQAQAAYREIGQMFFDLADRMDANLLSSIKSGVAQQFWEIEIERKLWPLLNEEVRYGKNSE